MSESNQDKIPLLSPSKLKLVSFASLSLTHREISSPNSLHRSSLVAIASQKFFVIYYNSHKELQGDPDLPIPEAELLDQLQPLLLPKSQQKVHKATTVYSRHTSQTCFKISNLNELQLSLSTVNTANGKDAGNCSLVATTFAIFRAVQLYNLLPSVTTSLHNPV